MDFKKILADNYIRLTKKGISYRCRVCAKPTKKGCKTGILVGNLNQVEKHIDSDSHQNNLKELIRKKDIYINIYLKNSIEIINVRYCTQCQVCLKNDEIFRCHCLLHFYETYKDCLIDTDVITFNFDKGKILINCLLCNDKINDEIMLAIHLESEEHTNRLNLLSKFKIPKILEDSMTYKVNSNFKDLSECNNKPDIIVVPFCTLCDQKIVESNIIEHIKKKNHNQNEFLKLEFEDNGQIEINFPDLYICFVCNKTYSNQIFFLKHFNSKEHIYISRSFHKILENSSFIIKTENYKSLFYCKICHIRMYHIKSVLDHMQGRKHCLNAKKIGTCVNEVSIRVSTASVSIPVCTSQNDGPSSILENKDDTKYNSYDNINDILNKLVPFDSSLKKTREAKNKKSGGKSKHHLQSHFDQNLWNFANSYIEMCIELGEKNIYNIKLELETMLNISYLIRNLWYYAQVFLCNICNKRIEFELDFIIHLISKTHINKVKKLKLKSKEMRFFICPVCVTYWYGETDTFDIHCEALSHKRCLITNEFMVPDLSKIVIDLLTQVDKNVNHLLNESNKTYNDEQEKELLKSIETVAQVAYPEAKAYIFGSRLSHLGFPDSDVDIFLDCENVYYNKQCSNKQSAKYLETIRHLLVAQQDSWIIEEVLLRTRVPILKLKHIDTNLKCDISFLNGLGVEKSKLIRHFNEAYPMCRQLILYFKKWLKNCRLLGASGITTYAASWFVIFHLQTENILPNVHSLLETKQTKLVDDWNCSFTDIIPVTTTNLTFNNLLKKFFLFYATFDYQSNVVCPLLGKLVKKSSFAKFTELPQEMDIYKKRLNNNEIEFFRLDSPLCIQDPVDQSQNMTKALPKHLLRYFIEYCAASAEHLKTRV